VLDPRTLAGQLCPAVAPDGEAALTGLQPGVVNAAPVLLRPESTDYRAYSVVCSPGRYRLIGRPLLTASSKTVEEFVDLACGGHVADAYEALLAGIGAGARESVPSTLIPVDLLS
jgi:hypothetical protein